MPEAVRYSSFSNLDPCVLLPRTRFTVNSTSIEVSNASLFNIDREVRRNSLPQSVIVHIARPRTPANRNGRLDSRTVPFPDYRSESAAVLWHLVLPHQP